jgi:hypothetical protein
MRNPLVLEGLEGNKRYRRESVAVSRKRWQIDDEQDVGDGYFMHLRRLLFPALAKVRRSCGS